MINERDGGAEEILHKKGGYSLKGEGGWEKIFQREAWPKRGRPSWKRVGSSDF